METILYNSNILSEQDIPFINQLAKNLEDNGVKLILIGWNPVLPEWNLLPIYFKLPNQLDFFNKKYSEQEIDLDFKKHNLSIEFLLNRFNWWFPSSKSEDEKQKRLNFLYFYLHHYLKLIKKYNPSLLLIWNGNDPRQYILGELSKEFNINKLFIERGPLPSVIFYDTLGVLSNSTLSLIDNKKFINGFECYERSKKYLEWYSHSSETLWEQPKTEGKINLRERFGIKNNQKLTVFIGQVDNDIQTKLFSPHFSSNLNAFDWFLKNGKREGYFVIGKHHPKSLLSVEKYKDFIYGIKNVAWTNEIPLDDLLNAADNIVAVNSSVIFDALIHGKPVFSLGDSILSRKEILYEYQPNNYKDELDAFYTESNLSNKLRNFNNFLELLFKENIVFTKSDLNSLDFFKKLKLLKSTNKNSNDIVVHDKIIRNYYRNVKIHKSNYDKVLEITRKLKNKLNGILQEYSRKN